MARWRKRSVYIGGGVMAVLLLAAAAFWWLSQANIDASWLKSSIESRIETQVPGLQARLGTIRAHRIPWAHSVRVVVKSSTLRYHEISADVGSLTLDIDESALLGGPAIIQSAKLEDVAATIPWSLSNLKASLSKDTHEPPFRLPWSDNLRSVTVGQSTVVLWEKESNLRHRFDIDHMEGVYKDKKQPIHLTLRAVMSRGTHRIALALSGVATPKGPWQATTTLTATSLIDALGPLAPDLENIHLIAPVGIKTTLTSTDVLSARTTISIGKGNLDAPAYWPLPLLISEGEASLDWDGSSKTLRVSSFNLQSGDALLKASATWPTKDPSNQTARAQLINVSIVDLLRLWPEGVAAGGRRWVSANISAGRIPQAQFDLVKGAKPQEKLSFNYEGLTVHYRKPMPPVLQGRGTAELIGDQLIFSVAGGSVNNLPLKPSTVTLANLSKRKKGTEYADVMMGGTGKSNDLLALLDSPPLGYISDFGMDPTIASGGIDWKARLKIPLLSSVKFKDVDFSADVTTSNLRLAKFIGIHDISAGKMLFSATQKGLTATGTAKVGPQPFTLDWKESFKGKEANPSRYRISMLADPDKLAVLGIDLQNTTTGPLRIEAQLSGKGQHIQNGRLQAFLNEASVKLPGLGVSKAAGVPGTFNADISGSPDRYSLDNIKASIPGLRLSGRLEVDSSAQLYHWILKSVEVPRADFSADIIQREGQATSVTLVGKRLDVSQDLQRFMTAAPSSENKPPLAPVPPKPPVLWPDIKGSATFDKVRLSDNDVIEDARLGFETRANLLASLSLVGKLNGHSAVSGNLTTQPSGRMFTIDAQDAGALAKALDLYRSGQGGRLSIQGQARGTGASLQLDGSARMTDFRVLNAPVLARTLTLASLTGLSDTLQGKGIEFKKMTVPFSLRSGVITLKGVSATGPGMAVTMEGQVQQSLRRMNMKGVIVPSYGLNGLVGKIPLLGPLVVGGKHQGLIGFTYRVEGPVNNPTINVNPASGLAPGFLRALFSGAPAEVGADGEAQEPNTNRP